jgi:hypothetical protein
MTGAAALAIAQALYGAYQTYQGWQASKQEQSKYEIPDSAKRQLSIAELLAADKKLPGQDLLEQKIGETTANAIKTAKEIGAPAQVLDVLGKLVTKENTAKQEIGVAAANNEVSMKRNLANTLGMMSGLEDKKWMLNEYQPYQEAMGAASALQESGTQNMFGAASTYVGQKQSQENWDKYLKAIMGTETTPGASPVISGNKGNYSLPDYYLMMNKSPSVWKTNATDWNNFFDNYLNEKKTKSYFDIPDKNYLLS